MSSVYPSKKFPELQFLDDDCPDPCDICEMTGKDKVLYGEFIRKSKIQMHYYCLLSGTHIPQTGEAEFSGVFGFLLTDIQRSFPRFKNNQCYICNKYSAPITCAHPDCDRSFHYICGTKQTCLTKFVGSFPSFCHDHHGIVHEEPHPNVETDCWICWESMGEYNPVTSVLPTCCPDRNQYWMHRDCIQRYAITSGHCFICPTCYSYETDFKAEAVNLGIFVPERDALWELDPDAYQDIHKCKCTSESCREKRKRPSDFVGCKACGGQTIHKKCLDADGNPDDYFCVNCMDNSFIQLL